MKVLVIPLFLISLYIIFPASQAVCPIANCKQCDVTNTTCLVCNSGYFLGNNTLCLAESDFRCDNSPVPYVGCESCIPGEGFVLQAFQTNLTACSPCMVNNCTNCQIDYTTCQACNGELILNNNTGCVDITTFNCLESHDFIGCSKCKQGQGPIANYHNTNLTACGNCLVTACSDCSIGYDKCDSCLPGFALSDTAHCQNITGFDCLTSADFRGCLTCPESKGLNRNFQGTNLTGCSVCHVTNCANCSRDYSTCDVCQPGFIKPDNTNNTCLDLSNWNCSKSSDQVGCTECKPGYGFFENYQNTGLSACAPCKASNCSQCFSRYDVCEICAPNAVLADMEGSECIDVTNWGCSAKADLVGCSACNQTSGFVYNFNNTGLRSCAACLTANCGNCTKDYTVCHNCTEGFALARYTTTPVQACVDCTNTLRCPRGLCRDFDGCIGCGNGFFQSKNESIFGMEMCSSCPRNCSGCVNATWCTDCDSSHQLRNTTQNGIFAQLCFDVKGADKILFGSLLFIVTIITNMI